MRAGWTWHLSKGDEPSYGAASPTAERHCVDEARLAVKFFGFLRKWDHGFRVYAMVGRCVMQWGSWTSKSKAEDGVG